jgi:hypothetical protein
MTQIPMDELDANRTFANAGSYPLDGTVAHITYGKNPWYVCF